MSITMPLQARRGAIGLERETRASGVAWKLARRELRRRPWRTVLVALLIALPVAGMQIASTLLASNRVSDTEAWIRSRGHADAVVYRSETAATDEPDDQFVARLAAKLPPGSSAQPVHEGWGRLRTAEHRRWYANLRSWVSDDDLADRILLLRGRPPRATDEVLLTEQLAERLGVDLGSDLHLVKPVESTWRVVGIGRSRSGGDEAQLGPGASVPDTRQSSVVVLVRVPGHVFSARDRAALEGNTGQPGAKFAPWATDQTPTVAEPQTPESAPEPHPEELAWTWLIGAIALVVLGIVITGAFSASSRRQLVTLGQLGASGAPPWQLRRTMVFQGLGVGIVGALAGSAMAAGTLLGGRDLLERITNSTYHPYRVSLVAVIVPVLLGVLAAAVAASIPARSVSRLPVLVSLAGRRPLTRVPRRVVVLGITACLLGTAQLGLAVAAARSEAGSSGIFTALAVIGAVMTLLGVCAVVPAIVGLVFARIRLSRAIDLAARGLVRNRTRTAAAVSAVCATCALALIGASAARENSSAPYFDGRDDEVTLQAQRFVTEGAAQESNAGSTEDPSVLPPAELVGRVRAIVPGTTELRFARLPPTVATMWLKDGSMGIENALVADETLLAAYPLNAAARAALNGDGAVVVAPTPNVGTIRLGTERTDPSTGRAVRTVVVDYKARPFGATLLVTPTTVASLRLPILQVPMTVLRAPRPYTAEELEDVEDELDVTPSDRAVWTGARTPARYLGTGAMPIGEILAGVALLITLAVIGGFMALSSAESRDERALLSVAGAPPRTLRAVNGWSGALIAALGALLAIPAGLIPLRVVRAAQNRAPFPIPWTAIFLLAAAVPAIIWVVTTALTGLSLRIRPVRPSSLFDQ